MARTRTGSFPIGFRRGGGDWQKDLGLLIEFAKNNGFEGLDIAALEAQQIRKVLDAGLRVGSVDLPQPWNALASIDAGKRKDAAQTCAAYIAAAVDAGAKVFFTVVIPEDHARDRKENFAFAVDGYGQLCAAVAKLPGTGAKIAVEGWPGPGPHFPSLACTTADYRALFKEVGSEVLGVNFDPSHLVRMGIDPLRFLHEFADRVYHVHGKDTELLPDELQEHGNLQQATFAKPHRWGGHHWRYTIPGHGCAPWARLLDRLRTAQYKGMVCIELEDENFNGTEMGEKRGLIASRDFLANV